MSDWHSMMNPDGGVGGGRCDTQPALHVGLNRALWMKAQSYA